MWSEHSLFSVTHYKIYRAISERPSKPFLLTFYYLGSVSASTFTFTDSEITIDPTRNYYAYYYVKAYNSVSDTYSNRTNIVSASGDYNPHKRVFTQSSIQKGRFFLSQCYPNPFNPSTKIFYTLPENAKVQIKVYDMLGKEVAELVNEIKPAGYHETTFNASELSGGIYMYRITSGIYSETKKMILLR